MKKEYVDSEAELLDGLDDELGDSVEVKETNNYVDKEKLCQHLEVYRAEFMDFKKKRSEAEESARVDALERGLSKQEANAAAKAAAKALRRPTASDYIGYAILRTAQGIAMKHCYRNYPFLEEMIGDAVENCVRYIHNFDPEETREPFSYITSSIERTFWRTIKKEKKKQYIQALKIQRAGIEDVMHNTQDHDQDENFRNTWIEKLQQSTDIIQDYEENLKKSQEKARKRRAAKKQKELEESNLDEFTQDDSDG